MNDDTYADDIAAECAAVEAAREADECLPTFNAETLVSCQPTNLLHGTAMAHILAAQPTRTDKLTPESALTDMTPAEIVAALNYRAAWVRRHCKVGSNILTSAAAYCIAVDMESAAEALQALMGAKS